MFANIKLRSAIALFRADIDRVIAAQSPLDRNYRFFDRQSVDGLRKEFLSDWENLLPPIMACTSRNDADQALIAQMDALVNYRLKRLTLMKNSGLDKQYMWEAPLWAYWSLHRLLLDPEKRANKASAEGPEIILRFAKFLRLQNEQRAMVAAIAAIMDKLPVYF